MKWFELKNPESIASPSLIIMPSRIDRNLQKMIDIAGDVGRLRPHVKTHKMLEVVRRQVTAGITKCKVATIAEAEMAASAGATDILLAYQPVGPDIDALRRLAIRYPRVSFATIVDNSNTVGQLTDKLGNVETPFPVFIDVDCGMHRTGVEIGPELGTVRACIESASGLSFAGLHVYDGHIHDASLEDRREKSLEVIDAVRHYHSQNPCPNVVGGGSPTFGIWAKETNWECSPGTPTLWDHGYGDAYPDLDFEIAAALLTRVVSKPGQDRLCLDIGYKAIASEMPLDRRVALPSIPDAALVGHSEEHLVVQTSIANQYPVGNSLLAFPKHICPTVALHAAAVVVNEDGMATGETWTVTARDR